MVDILTVTPISKTGKKVEMPNIFPGMKVKYKYIESEKVSVDGKEEIKILEKELTDVSMDIFNLERQWVNGIGKKAENMVNVETYEGDNISVTPSMARINGGLYERKHRRESLLEELEHLRDGYKIKQVKKTGESIVASLYPVDRMFHPIYWKASLTTAKGKYDIDDLVPGDFEQIPEFRSGEIITLPVLRKINPAAKYVRKVFNAALRRANKDLDKILGETQTQYLVDMVGQGYITTVRTEPFGENYEMFPQQFMVLSPATTSHNGASYRVFLTKPNCRGLYAASSTQFHHLYNQSKILMAVEEMPALTEVCIRD